MIAAAKWVAIAADILAYEAEHIHDGELLSQACDRWIEAHPVAARICIIAVGTLLTAHLANLIDPQYDPVAIRFWRRLGARLRSIRTPAWEFVRRHLT